MADFEVRQNEINLEIEPIKSIQPTAIGRSLAGWFRPLDVIEYNERAQHSFCYLQTGKQNGEIIGQD